MYEWGCMAWVVENNEIKRADGGSTTTTTTGDIQQQLSSQETLHINSIPGNPGPVNSMAPLGTLFHFTYNVQQMDGVCAVWPYSLPTVK